jgi:hypothetical protein
MTKYDNYDYEALKKKISELTTGKSFVYHSGRFISDLMGSCFDQDLRHEKFTTWCAEKSSIGELSFRCRKIKDGTFDYIVKRLK